MSEKRKRERTSRDWEEDEEAKKRSEVERRDFVRVIQFSGRIVFIGRWLSPHSARVPPGPTPAPAFFVAPFSLLPSPFSLLPFPQLSPSSSFVTASIFRSKWESYFKELLEICGDSLPLLQVFSKFQSPFHSLRIDYLLLGEVFQWRKSFFFFLAPRHFLSSWSTLHSSKWFAAEKMYSSFISSVFVLSSFHFLLLFSLSFCHIFSLSRFFQLVANELFLR